MKYLWALLILVGFMGAAEATMTQQTLDFEQPPKFLLIVSTLQCHPMSADGPIGCWTHSVNYIKSFTDEEACKRVGDDTTKDSRGMITYKCTRER